MSRGVEAVIAIALLAVFTAMVVGEARHQSVTVDEFHLVPQAIALRATGDLELGLKTPPLLKRWIGVAYPPGSVELPSHLVRGKPAMVGWTPWVFGTRFMESNRERYVDVFLRARMMMLPLAWALGLSVLFWARALGGQAAGLVALGLFSFSPEMIAFSSLVSLDLAVTALVVPAMFFLRQHVRSRAWWALVVSGALLGGALAVKLSVIALTPILVLPVIMAAARRDWRRAVAALLVVGIVPLLVLQMFYGFTDPAPRPRDLEPESDAFRSVVRLWPTFVPMPWPRAWVRALDLQARDVEVADVRSYLDGEWSDRGWKSYYARAFLYKTPMPLLALLALLAVSLAIDRPRPEVFETLVLVGPALAWAAMLSLAGGLNIGIRYVLPCYPFLYVLIALGVARLGPNRIEGRIASALLAGFAILSVAAWPHHLGYFNVFAGGRQHGWQHLADSNVDWGQELAHLGSYMRQRGIERIGLAYFGHVDPAIHGIEYTIPGRVLEPGWYAISVNYLLGYPYLAYDHGRLRPLRGDRFAAFSGLEPVDTIAGALMIYRVPSRIGSSGGDNGSDGALLMSTTSAWSNN